MTHLLKKRAGESGESLLTVMVALGIVGILSMIMMQVFSNYNQSQTALETRGEFEAMRRHLMNSVNCEATFDQPGCANPTPTPVSLLGLSRGGKAYEVNTKGRATLTVMCHTPSDADPILSIKAKRRQETRSLYIGCGIDVSNLDGNAGTDGKTGGVGGQGGVGSVGGQGGAGNSGTAEGDGQNGKNPPWVAMCQNMGGIWDAERKCLFVADNGGLVRRASTDAAKASQVIGCDIKTGGGGSDLKTCNEAGTGKKSCAFKNGNWTYIKGKEKVCAGGIVVDTDK